MLLSMKKSLAVFGNGNMGWSVLAGALDSGILSPDDVVVVESNPERAQLALDRGIALATPQEASQAKHLFLAVKPQIFQELAQQIGILEDRKVIISVMAGIGSKSIYTALGPNAAVVRVMPNTPAKIRSGISAICHGKGSEKEDLEFPSMLMASVGRVVEVDEEHMYAVTATSGSGPAFILQMAESMENAAINEGIPPSIARLLVQETIVGAGRLMLETGDEPSDLRAAVTSKGGTTAAGLDAMKTHGFDAAVSAAIRAATERGVQLDQEHG